MFFRCTDMSSMYNITAQPARGVRMGREINLLDTCRGVCAMTWAIAFLMYVTTAFLPQCVQLFLTHVSFGDQLHSVFCGR